MSRAVTTVPGLEVDTLLVALQNGETDQRLVSDGPPVPRALVNRLLDALRPSVAEARRTVESAEYVRHAGQQLVKAMDGLATGDLRVRFMPPVASQAHQETHEVFQSIAEAFDRSATAQRTAVRELKASAEEVVRAAAELAQSGEQLRSSAEETSDRARQVVGTTKQVSASTHSVSEGAEQMIDSVRAASRDVESADGSAQAAVTRNDEANEVIQRLGDSSREIGQMVKVIANVAQQTNLLALNATIEAARAGVAGEGFAVVAGEVKELAKQTALATDEVTGQVARIQKDAQHAVESISSIGDVIRQMRDIQASVSRAIERQEAATLEVCSNASGAASSSSSIVDAVRDVAVATQATTRDAESVMRSSRTLERLSGQLVQAVEGFRTD